MPFFFANMTNITFKTNTHKKKTNQKQRKKLHSLYSRQTFSTSANVWKPLNRVLNSDKAFPYIFKPIHMQDAQLHVTLLVHQHQQHRTTCSSDVLNTDSFLIGTRQQTIAKYFSKSHLTFLENAFLFHFSSVTGKMFRFLGCLMHTADYARSTFQNTFRYLLPVFSVPENLFLSQQHSVC